MTRHASRRAALGAVLLVLALGACSSDDPPATPSAGGAAASSAAPKPAAAKLRVAELLKKTGCKGKVIGTQMYSRETGRCTMPAGGEVTFALFDTNALRDQWVDFGKQYGGNYVVGAGWAAAADDPDDAATWAKKLSGKTV
jgi:hypothetical protein